MTKKTLCMDSFIIIHFAYKKNAPGRERKTSASNEGLTSGAAG
jgi:hypothetical protein